MYIYFFQNQQRSWSSSLNNKKGMKFNFSTGSIFCRYWTEKNIYYPIWKHHGQIFELNTNILWENSVFTFRTQNSRLRTKSLFSFSNRTDFTIWLATANFDHPSNCDWTNHGHETTVILFIFASESRNDFTTHLFFLEIFLAPIITVC